MSELTRPASAAPMPAAAPPVDYRALAAILLAVALATLDTAIANTALPAIAADLGTTPAASIWIINAYQLTVVATLMPFAALGDRWGPRRIYLGGLAFFTLASLGCALARSLPELTVARALQGLGGSALMSVNIALIRSIYPLERLGRGVGFNALVVGVSFAVGPTVASMVLALGPWPWLFALNVPLGLLALAFAWPTLPRPQPRSHAPGQGFDPLAALLSCGGFAALIYALGAAAQREDARLVGLSVAASVLLLTLLARRERGRLAPMLPLDLLRRPMFALSAVTALAAFATQSLAYVSLPFLFEQVLHRDPVQTGFLMAPWAVVVAAAAPLAGRLSDRYPPGLLGGIGLSLLCLGMVLLAWMPEDVSALGISWRMMLCGAGFGFFQSPNLKAIMSSAPPQRSGGASGVIGMVRLIGQSGGAALVALCFGLAGVQSGHWALLLGAGFAALAAGASFARLWAR